MRFGSLRMTSAVDDLLGDQDHSTRGQARLAGDAQVAPAVGVAFGVGALHVQDGHVGLDRLHVKQTCLGGL